jgi:hypothetical protein
VRSFGLAGALALTAILGCSSSSPPRLGSGFAAPTPAIAGSREVGSWPAHVFLVVMENHEYGDVLGNPQAPFLNQLAAGGLVAQQYYALTHPSLPNYLALLGGDTFGITSDCTDCFVSAPSLPDQLEAAGLTWQSYQEDLPAPCFLGASAGNYALKHDPFLYFRSIRDNPGRCRRVVPLPQLSADLRQGTVPNFAWITPSLVNDMHSGTIAGADRWLARVVPAIEDSAAWRAGGLLIVVWDEGTSNAACCGANGTQGAPAGGAAQGGHVPLLVVSSSGVTGQFDMPANHYVLLRALEDLWRLPPLAHSGDPEVAAPAAALADRLQPTTESKGAPGA